MIPTRPLIIQQLACKKIEGLWIMPQTLIRLTAVSFCSMSSFSVFAFSPLLVFTFARLHVWAVFRNTAPSDFPHVGVFSDTAIVVETGIERYFHLLPPFLFGENKTPPKNNGDACCLSLVYHNPIFAFSTAPRAIVFL